MCVSRGCGTSQQRAVGRQAPLYTPILPLYIHAVISLARPAEECAQPDVDLCALNGKGRRLPPFFTHRNATVASLSDDTIEEM